MREQCQAVAFLVAQRIGSQTLSVASELELLQLLDVSSAASEVLIVLSLGRFDLLIFTGVDRASSERYRGTGGDKCSCLAVSFKRQQVLAHRKDRGWRTAV